MQDANIPTPGQAATRLARMHRYGHTPSPEEEHEARLQLHAARIDREIRDMERAGVHLDEAYAGHLIGLLLAASGVKYDAATPIERIARLAVRDAQEA